MHTKPKTHKSDASIRPERVGIFTIYMSLLGLNILTCLILVICNKMQFAKDFSIFATLFVVFGFLFYAIVFHSKKRWNNLKWYERMIKILTYQSK